MLAAMMWVYHQVAVCGCLHIRVKRAIETAVEANAAQPICLSSMEEILAKMVEHHFNLKGAGNFLQGGGRFIYDFTIGGHLFVGNLKLDEIQPICSEPDRFLSTLPEDDLDTADPAMLEYWSQEREFERH